MVAPKRLCPLLDLAEVIVARLQGFADFFARELGRDGRVEAAFGKKAEQPADLVCQVLAFLHQDTRELGPFFLRKVGVVAQDFREGPERGKDRQQAVAGVGELRIVCQELCQHPQLATRLPVGLIERDDRPAKLGFFGDEFLEPHAPKADVREDLVAQNFQKVVAQPGLAASGKRFDIEIVEFGEAFGDRRRHGPAVVLDEVQITS